MESIGFVKPETRSSKELKQNLRPQDGHVVTRAEFVSSMLLLVTYLTWAAKILM